MIGDSDTHNSSATPEEDNYTGKFAIENDPKHRLEGPPGFKDKNKQQLREFSSGGLAGVWAESEHARSDLRTRSSARRLRDLRNPHEVRVFAGFDFAPNALDSDQWLKDAYAGGVPMGGDLRANASGKAPTLLIKALKEVDGANLDRIQVIKGWVEDGKTHEKIYDVAASGDRKPDEPGAFRRSATPLTSRPPPIQMRSAPHSFQPYGPTRNSTPPRTLSTTSVCCRSPRRGGRHTTQKRSASRRARICPRRFRNARGARPFGTRRE